MTHNILVSACLLGEAVRYDGRDNGNKVAGYRLLLGQWRQQGRLIPFCPEVAGGLPTPRPAAEIIAASGADVLAGTAQVMTISGENCTAEFIQGARLALEIARRRNVSAALLAARSPSCGSDGIYNGEFSGILTAGTGVTAALLEQHGIPCFSPERFDELETYLSSLA